MTLTIPCPHCPDGFTTHGDRHARTAKDVCGHCGGTMRVPARKGETAATAYDPGAPIICDVPVCERPGGIGFHIPAGRAVEWGHDFCLMRGYRVYLRFPDSVARASMAPETVRRLVAAEFPVPSEAEAQFIDALRRMADQADALTAAWIQAGRRPVPLDAEPVGTA